MSRMRPVSAEDKPAGTQSIRRVVMLLRELAGNNLNGLRLVDLVRQLKLEQPTVHRMLKSLIAETLVMQDAATRRYFLGPAMFEFGLAAALRFDLRALCEPLLDALARDTGDTVFLNVRSGSDAVCVDRKEGASPIKIYTLNIGDRRPLGAGAGGLAILCAMPPQAMRAIVHENAARLASHAGLDADTLLRQAARARKLGYALHKVRNFEGVKALGMPITDASGQPVAAISLSTLSARLGGQRLEEVLKLIRLRVRAIEVMLAKQARTG